MPTFLRGCRIAVAGNIEEPTPDQISGWIKHGGGKLQGKTIDECTTHLVAHEKAWKNGSKLVQDSLKVNADGGNIKIVKIEWLKESASNKKKEKEDAYLWEKTDATTQLVKSSQTRGKPCGTTDPKRGRVGGMTELFSEQTSQCMDDDERKMQQWQADREKADLEKRNKDMKEMMKLKRKIDWQQAANSLAMGPNGRGDEFLDDAFDIYVDNTGFKYDILLVKYNIHNNQNFRATLKIHKHKDDPDNHAVTVNISRTNYPCTNTILAPAGTNFPTAARKFKKVFQECTHVEWKDRFNEARKRAAANQRKRELAIGRGVDRENSVSGSGRSDSTRTDYVDLDAPSRPFEYHPPKMGSKGRMDLDANTSARVPFKAEDETAQSPLRGNTSAALEDVQDGVKDGSTHQPSLTLNVATNSNDYDCGQDVVLQYDDIADRDLFKEKDFERTSSGGEPTLSEPDEHLDINHVAANDTSLAAMTQHESYLPNVTQGVGTTQITERVQSHPFERMDSCASDFAVCTSEHTKERSLKTIDGAGSVQLQSFNFGASILGKRKDSKSQVEPPDGKKQKVTNVDEVNNALNIISE